MRHWLSSLVVVCAIAGLVGCAAPESSVEERTPKTYSIQEFLDTVSYSGASFSPDGSKLLVRSDVGGVANAYAIPVDGGEPVQLTDLPNAVGPRRYFPDDERFLFEMDEGGNELDHLYVRELDGSLNDLTPGDNLKASYVAFAGDGKSFFVGTNERDPRHFDIYEYQSDGYARERVFQNDDALSPGDVSPDGRYLAFTKTVTRADSDVYVFDRESQELKHITPHEGDVSHSVVEFHPDGSRLLFLTDEGSEFTYLVSYDLASGKRETVLQPKWDVRGAGFSDSGKYLVVSINNDARTVLRMFDTESESEVKLPRLPLADISGLNISPDETTIAFYMSRAKNPRDLYVMDLGDDEPRALTRSLSADIDPDDLVEPEIVRFASYDGVEIPGILYKPHGVSAASKAPALVSVHGGPGGQSRVGYNEVLQYLVNHGYVVYQINNRGSSGYGKTFFAMDDRKHGEADLGDVVASKQMLIDTGYVDPERIGIMGGSYGGYMVLAALAFEPDVFDVGIDIFGVSNWLRTLESIPPYWEAIRAALYNEMGDPATDRERLERISPLFHAENITKPLLVLQGANDPRVLQVESDEIVEAVEANGVPVEYVVFPDEGHGFSQKHNREQGFRQIRVFLDQHLKGEAPTAVGG